MDDDPWNWEVNRVVKELCTLERSWESRFSLESMPDLTELEQNLRENDVTGQALLTCLDQESMRELGARTLKHRQSLNDAVFVLRRRSAVYASNYAPHLLNHHGPLSMNRKRPAEDDLLELANKKPRTDDASPQASGNSGPMEQDTNLQNPAEDSAPAEPVKERKRIAPTLIGPIDPSRIRDLPVVDDASVSNADESHGSQSFEDTQEAINAQLGQILVGGDTEKSEVSLISEDTIADDAAIPIDDATADKADADSEIPKIAAEDDVAQDVRKPGMVFIDEAGRKRTVHILQVDTTSEVPSNKEGSKISGDAEDGVAQDVQMPGTIFIDETGRKRIVPILQAVSTSEAPSNEEESKDLDAAKATRPVTKSRVMSQEEILAQGYLGKHKLTVDEIFYGKGPVEFTENEAGAPDTFAYNGQRISTGRRLYVNGLMKRFLGQNNFNRIPKFSRNGKTYSAIVPYSINLVPDGKDRYFTLLTTSDDGEVHTSKEIASKWPELIIEGESRISQAGQLNSLGFPVFSDHTMDYDALEKRYANIPGGDTELPAWGDSGSEGDYDSETWDEILAENSDYNASFEKRRNNRGISLDADQILDAINEGIVGLERKWQTEKLPNLALKGWQLFCKFRRLGNSPRRNRKRQLKEEISHLDDDRIPKLRKEIAAGDWSRRDQVLRHTQRSMEVTVFDQQHKLWELAILRSKMPPPKPATTPSKAKKEASEPKLANGEGLGESDAMSEDDLDDFVSDDGLENRTDGPTDNESDSSEAEEENSKSVVNSPPKLISSNTAPHSSPRADAREMFRENGPITDDEDEAQLPADRQPSTSARTTKHLSKIIDLTISSDESAAEDVPRTPHSRQGQSSAPPLGNSSQPAPINLVTPRKEAKYIVNSIGKTDAIVISSDDEKSSPVSKAPLPGLDELPAYHELAKIGGMSYDVLEQLQDRDRLIIAFLYRMKPVEDRTRLLSEFKDTEEPRMWHNFRDAIQAMLCGQHHIMESSTFEAYVTIIRMLRMYVECKHSKPFVKKDGRYTDVTRVLVGELEEHKAEFAELYKLVLDFSKDIQGSLEEDDDSEDELPVLRRPKRPSPWKETPKRIIAENDDSEAGEQSGEDKSPEAGDRADEDESSETEVIESSPRKRKIHENQEARELRESNKERIEQQRKRRAELQLKFASQGISTTSDSDKIIINDSKLEDQGFIYVDPAIGKRIKPHQITGVRFMWEQIVMDPKMQGCLLAHMMGLGKTMQVITLLVAIANAAKSEDDSISGQIPPKLRKNRTLVLCPAGLVDNWEDELLTWAPQDTLGNPFKLPASLKNFSRRLEIIQEWYTDGGVLILGYDMFRILLSNKETRSAYRDPKAPLSEEQHTLIKTQLLEGPAIIIADEAHKLKNRTSLISQLTGQFKSESRIALTGSPLNNNIEEYYTMINWVAPNYLGPYSEFNAKYKMPIEEGLYFDSDPNSRRRSRKMLAVLISDLELKVNRATMSVLRNDLPPKKEFVIRVSLTELQRDAYLIYVNTMRNNTGPLTEDGDMRHSTLWTWLAELELLCNHPAVFKKKIEQAPKKSKKKGQNRQSSLENDAEEHAVTQIAKTDGFVPIRDLLNSVEDINLTALSNKMLIFQKILDESRVAKDKVLVFTHSLPTLDFLEIACQAGKHKYQRLDGHTIMNKRQEMTKDFNTGNTQVFLISTQAGSLGLNLFAANRVIIFDFKYNPTAEEQAVGRAYRIGQLKPVFVYRFVVAGTFETKLENKAVYKMQLASRVVDKQNVVPWAKKAIAEYLDDPEELDREDLTEFHGEDVILDKILHDSATKSVIRSIMKTDTYAEADNEDLTAEDHAEVALMREEEKLKRTHPDDWQELLAKRRKNEATAALAKQAAIKATQRDTVALNNESLAAQVASLKDMHLARENELQEPTLGTDSSADESGNGNQPEMSSNPASVLPNSQTAFATPIASTGKSTTRLPAWAHKNISRANTPGTRDRRFSRAQSQASSPASSRAPPHSI